MNEEINVKIHPFFRVPISPTRRCGAESHVHSHICAIRIGIAENFDGEISTLRFWLSLRSNGNTLVSRASSIQLVHCIAHSMN